MVADQAERARAHRPAVARGLERRQPNRLCSAGSRKPLRSDKYALRLDEVAAQKTHLDHARESCRKALAELDERLAGMATAKQRADELCELVRSVREGLPDLPNEERYRVINLLDVQITLDFEGEAGRGKHPTLYADVVCNLTLDSIRLWVLGDLGADGNKTTTP